MTIKNGSPSSGGFLDEAACCAVCATRDHDAFSKRQLKRAAERKPARCTKCIEQDSPVPESKKSKDEKQQVPKKKTKQEQAEEKEKPKEEKEQTEESEKKKEETQKKERLYFSDGESASQHSSSSSVSAAAGNWSDDAAEAEESPKQQQQEDNDETSNENVDVSLNAIKQQVLGRAVRVDDNDFENPSLGMNGEALEAKKVNLRRELSCAICHEAFYQPLSLNCGHSFCKGCIHWWITHSQQQQQDDHGTCPTCRRALTSNVEALGVNTALRACVGALFQKDLQARIQAEQEAKLKVTRGENGGAHSGGYIVLSPIEDEPWETIRLKNNAQLRLRRSIIIDAQDQRMQLALALRVDESSFMRQDGDNILQIVVCMLTMEEDEVCDGDGFPWIIKEEEEDDNDALVARDCVNSFVDATSKVSQSETVPIARRGMRDGIARFLVDIDMPTLEHMTSICFCDEESKAELEIKVPEQRWLEGGSNAIDAQAQERVADHANRIDMTDDHEEDEDSHLDQFEEDGFVVMEGEDEEEHQDENDLCCLCKHGGELMVCDGGLNSVEGCGRSFHVECVGREKVPPGDWVCETCANEHELDVGMEGYEFPATEAEETVGEQTKPGQDSFEESDGGEESDESTRESLRRAAKKRRVIMDSDEEDDDMIDDGGDRYSGHDPDDFAYGHDQSPNHSENEDKGEDDFDE